MPKPKEWAFPVAFSLGILTIPVWLFLLAGFVFLAGFGIPLTPNWTFQIYMCIPFIVLVSLPVSWKIRNRNPRMSIWLASAPAGVMIIYLVLSQLNPMVVIHRNRFPNTYSCSDGSRIQAHTIASVSQVYLI